MMILNLAAMRNGNRRLRSVALYDIVAAFVHATSDEVVAVLTPDGLLERDERKASMRGPAALHESVQDIRMARERGDVWDTPPSRSCGHLRMPWRRLRGRCQR